jgi:hypothetical protein
MRQKSPTVAEDIMLKDGVALKASAGLVEIKSSVAALGASKDDGNSTEQLKDGGEVFASVDLAPN